MHPARPPQPEQRGHTNGEFLLGKTEEHMDELLERFPADDTTIILDPPRKGCHQEGLDMLVKASRARSSTSAATRPPCPRSQMAV